MGETRREFWGASNILFLDPGDGTPGVFTPQIHQTVNTICSFFGIHIIIE